MVLIGRCHCRFHVAVVLAGHQTLIRELVIIMSKLLSALAVQDVMDGGGHVRWALGHPEH